MGRKIAVTRTIVMVAGLVQLVLGALFWAGIAKGLVPVHITVGLVLVISLWTLTFFCARAGAGAGLVVLVAVWGLIVPAIGMAQTSILPGSLHWVIQLVHVAVGLTALGLANLIAGRVLPRRPAETEPAQPAVPGR
jgi:hypothetical protein